MATDLEKMLTEENTRLWQRVRELQQQVATLEAHPIQVICRCGNIIELKPDGK